MLISLLVVIVHFVGLLLLRRNIVKIRADFFIKDGNIISEPDYGFKYK